MERVKLGRTGIEVSRLGIGTGTAHPSGHCAQAMMEKSELAALLHFAYEMGINFWDTAFTYRTYPHIREALKGVRRSDIVLSTKLSTSCEKDTFKDFHSSLKELDIDYFDICLLHGVRTGKEIRRRRGAIDALLRLKEEGKIRAAGLSSHGMSALRSAMIMPEIEVVWARTNYAGLMMDSSHLGLYDELASVPFLKKAVSRLPRWALNYIRPKPGSKRISTMNHAEVLKTLAGIHSRSKGVVGMKVFAEGHLREDPERAVGYVKALPFVDSFIIGMLNRNEIEVNCRIVNNDSRG